MEISWDLHLSERKSIVKESKVLLSVQILFGLTIYIFKLINKRALVLWLYGLSNKLISAYVNRRHFCLKFCARAKDDTKLLQVFDLVIKFGINSQNLFIINREFTKSSGPWSSEHSLQSLAKISKQELHRVTATCF